MTEVIKKRGRPSVAAWMEEIRRGQLYKKKHSGFARWKDLRAYYRGEFPGYNVENGSPDTLPYNVTFGMARVTVPNVYFRNPYVMCSPRPKPQTMPGLDFGAKVVESVDNWMLYELGVKSVMKSGILDTFLTGVGIYKIGYDSEYGTSAQHILQDELTGTLSTQYNKSGKERLEFNAKIKPGMPWVVRVDPFHIITPWGAKSVEDMPWIDHMYLRRLEDIKQDPKMHVPKDLRGTHVDSDLIPEHMREMVEGSPTQAEYVLVHEIRDARRREVLAVIEGQDRPIYGPDDDLLQTEGLNYISLAFNEDPERFWCPSDASIMEPQQLEMNDTRTQAMYHRRIAVVRMLVEKGLLTPESMTKFISATPGGVVESELPPTTDRVMQFQPHIPPELVQWVEVVRSDTRELMGVGKQQMGEQSSGRKTATESQIVEMAHRMRMNEKQDAAADALEQIVRKLNQVVFTFWDADRVVPIVGYEGAVHWVTVTQSDIAAEYDVKVDVESMTPQTKQMRRKDLIQLIQALSMNPRANLDYLLRMLLREFDWLDAMQILPDAQMLPGFQGQQGQPETMQQYAGGQQKLLNNPQQMAQMNQRVAAALPQGVGSA